MKKTTKIVLCVLAIFIVGVSLGVAFTDPVEATKYENKDNITVEIKDNEKTVNVTCNYNDSHSQYLGHTFQNGKRYDVSIFYEYRDGMQHGKKGWWTSATDGGMSDNARTDSKHNNDYPITALELQG